MSLKVVSKDTLAILERGSYVVESGARVDLRKEIKTAKAGTVLHSPAESSALLEHHDNGGRNTVPAISVTAETTGEAGQRLASSGENWVALNFASAKNPGGGFLNGAKAQEEDLARASALYVCQLEQPGYYDENRATDSMLYTDNIIYSPVVPFFRARKGALLKRPFFLSVITAPAPNAGHYLHRNGTIEELASTLRRRAGLILAIAEAHGHRNLLLGAWGCGVFRNDPKMIAETFKFWLTSDRFSAAFDQVVFAVYDRDGSAPNRSQFEKVFAE